MKAARLLASLAVLVSLGAACSGHRGRSKEQVTANRMTVLYYAIAGYRARGLSLPTTLEKLLAPFDTLSAEDLAASLVDGSGEDLGTDGWGRRFVYFVHGNDYLLASFGANGKPEPQASSRPGYVANASGDLDFVIINEDWVQWSDRVQLSRE